MEQQEQQGVAKKKPFVKAEDIFKIVMCLVVIMWSVCVKDLFEFRQYLQDNNMFHFSVSYLWYVGISFTFMITTKYGYYAIVKNYVDKNVLAEKYEGESRKLKLQSMLKLSYDSLFYLFASAINFFLFREEPWFPNWVGGEGKCQNLFIQYPTIPLSNQHTMQIFYNLQLGVHAFSVFEMVVIKRKTELKYYEKLLHHLLAVSLIGFSAMSNEVLIGVLVLFTHDFSDVFMAFGRTYIQTKFKKVWYVGIPVIFAMVFSWIYMRIIAFPFCLISEVHAHSPNPTDPWYMVNYPHKMLQFKLIVLLGMHIYWTYHLLRSVYISVKKKNYGNHHEPGKQKDKLKHQQSSS